MRPILFQLQKEKEMGIENFMTFMMTALFFLMIPGIDTVFVLNKSIGQSRRAGVYATFGVNSGVLVHTLFAALGLSILVAKSAVAFDILKYVGAGYLIYLGILQLKNKDNILSNQEGKQDPKTVKSSFWSGFMTNALNPKVALFFLAFFPQFINPTQLENPVPFILLGLTYGLIGVVWFLILTVFAGLFSKKIQQHPQAGVRLNKISGVVFILMAIKIAVFT